MDDQARALVIVAAVLSSLSGSAGFVGGRMTAPAPAPEVRFVSVPSPPAALGQNTPTLEVAPIEPATTAPVPLVPMTKMEPNDPAATPAPAVVKPPLPQPRPKVDAKPKPQPAKPTATKPRPVRKPTAGECAQLKIGFITIGRGGVYEKAKARNYTKAQVDWAIEACGL